MGRKRVEENGEMENIVIDDSMQSIPMTEIPKKVQREEVPASSPSMVSKAEPVNCLRNERIIVRFVPRPTSMVQNAKHILYGGMADTAKRSFVVPRLNSTGMFKNVLTDNEKNFLEKAMGLEYNALSVYRKKDNFWDDSNPMGIGRVTLHKQDNYLDLSVPEDYIKYKILLANKDQIASSLQELEDRPKATYQFVIISENAEAMSSLSKMDTIQRCYMEYGKVEDQQDVLRVLIELLEGRPIAPKVKIDYLKSKVNEYIQRNPRLFLSTIKDELLPAKVLIKKCVDAGLIGKKNDAYYLREDGTPLCEMNEESTLNNAARYISSIKRQELKYKLEARLKEE
jgi:hypothetical protein